jgi:hypothetical protein
MLRRKHEQSVIDLFFRHLTKVARNSGKKFYSFSFDGQDNFVGADYLLTETTKFAVTEFKYEESDIPSERNKPLRHEMCLRLENEAIRKIEHENCHFIAWSSGLILRTMHFNSYSNEVCNQKVLGLMCGLEITNPISEKRINADLFINQFLSGKLGLPFKFFHSYINWLVNNPDNDDGDGPQEFIELLMLDETMHDFAVIGFSNLLDLKKWLDDNHTEPAMEFFSP